MANDLTVSRRQQRVEADAPSPASAASSPSRMTQTRSLLLVPSRSIWRSPRRIIRSMVEIDTPSSCDASTLDKRCFINGPSMPGSELSVPLHWSVTLVPPASAQDNGL